MSSIISSMLQQLFPKTEFRCLDIGLDASGKTTILYKLKLGEIVTTIPTIGFNVETVDHRSTSLTIWDVGGCDKIRPLWRHYYQNTQAIIFVLDTNDTHRFDEAMELFRDTITAEELTNAVILCFLNKIDLCVGTSAEQVKEKFLTASADILRNRTYHVEFSCAPSGEGLYEGLDWLVGALRNRPAADVAAAQKAQPREPTEKERLESQLEEWLSREDEPANVFLDQLRDYTLDSWDHYTHLRIAYLLLSMHGRREGMQFIFRDIKSFIENSPRTRRGGTSDAAANRGTTFHETMTYFWVHMVHYAMESSRAPTEAFQSIPSLAIVDGVVPENSDVPPVQPSAWKVFLLMNPQLANGGLFLHYYSKQRMLLDPDARTMVLLPDKVPLPSLLVDVNSSNTAAASGVSADKHLPRAPLTDAHFLELLTQNQLPGWGHEVKLRVIYLLLCRWGGRSSKSVDGVLEMLQSIEKSGFHLTLSYFWIQMVTYHITVEEREQKTAARNGDTMVFSFSQQPTHTGAFGLQELQNALAQEEFNSATPTSGGEATLKCMTFADFLLRPHCQPLRNSELHSKYYSRKVLEADSAASELALPDLKNLPSVV